MNNADKVFIAAVVGQAIKAYAPSHDDLAKKFGEIHDVVKSLPVPKDGKSITAEDIAPLIEDGINKAIAAIPAPKDGKDIDPNEVKRLLDEAVAALPAPKDGESVTPE